MRLDQEMLMPAMFVTCPESAHLEEIEYDAHPLGLLITSCTGFSPPCSVSCERTCAARMDRRRRRDESLADDDETLVNIRL